MRRKQIDKEINIKDLLFVIKQRIWIVILFTGLFTALGSIYISMPQTPLYEASSRIYLQASTDLFNNLKVILREPVVMQQVAKELNLNRPPEVIRGQITIASVDGSTVLRLSVIDPDPVLAANIANTVVKAYKQVAQNTVFFANVIVLTEAEIKTNPQPINPQTNRVLYFGIIVGMLLGIGVVFLVDSLDDTIQTEREIEQLLGVTVLGNVASIRRRDIVKKVNKQRNLSVRGETIGS